MSDERGGKAGSARMDADRQRKLLLALCRRHALDGMIYLHFDGGVGRQGETRLVHTYDDAFGEMLKAEHLPTLRMLAERLRHRLSPEPLADHPEGAVLLRDLQVGASSGLLFPLHGPAGLFAMAVALHGEQGLSRRHMALLHFFMTCYFERLLACAPVQEVKLSRRELECLHWCACGKSYWETSVILGISERTVHHHMKMVRQKLGVQTNAQAVARASVLGLTGEAPCSPAGLKRSA